MSETPTQLDIRTSRYLSKPNAETTRYFTQEPYDVDDLERKVQENTADISILNGEVETRRGKKLVPGDTFTFENTTVTVEQKWNIGEKVIIKSIELINLWSTYLISNKDYKRAISCLEIVDKKIKDAQSIWFEVQIRNYKYVYTLK